MALSLLLPGSIAKFVRMTPAILLLVLLSGPMRLLQAQMAPKVSEHAFDPGQLGAGERSIEQGLIRNFGDDPRWADPAFDDHDWKPARTDDFHALSIPQGQLSWYRMHLTLHRQDPRQKLALLLWADDSYEVYWNGQKFGHDGEIWPSIFWPHGQPRSYPLPIPNGETISGVLAVRVWCQRESSTPTLCGISGPVRVGSPALEQLRIDRWRTTAIVRRALTNVLGLVAVAICFGAFVVYLRHRSELIYLWFALFFAGASLDLLSFPWFGPFLPNPTGFVVAGLYNALTVSVFLLVWMWLLGIPTRSRIYQVAYLWSAINALNLLADDAAIVAWAHAGSGMVRFDAISTWIQIGLQALMVPILVVSLIYKRSRGNWFVIVAALIETALLDLWTLQGDWPDVIPWHMSWLNQRWMLGDFEVTLQRLSLLLLLVAMAVAMVRKVLHERRQQEAMRLELKSAREIQQVMVPEQVPAIPGYAITSIYRPAAEVGGDFVQVIPLEDGGALIAIGDVSGKGIRAAMIVALIIGTLRTAIRFSQSPSELMAELNERLYGRMAGGFATCLLVRINPEGLVTVANAAHIPPYREGVPVPVEGSLPLGMIAGLNYDETAFALNQNETLVLLTDGVLEARNTHRELFGFDRLRDLLRDRPTAQDVVDAACIFGQDDDISVVTLTRLAAERSPAAATLDWSMQIS
jgi:hypothetical protein